jgi:hypothetical protein
LISRLAGVPANVGNKSAYIAVAAMQQPIVEHDGVTHSNR